MYTDGLCQMAKMDPIANHPSPQTPMSKQNQPMSQQKRRNQIKYLGKKHDDNLSTSTYAKRTQEKTKQERKENQKLKPSPSIPDHQMWRSALSGGNGEECSIHIYSAVRAV